jgi:hypothetical protein
MLNGNVTKKLKTKCLALFIAPTMSLCATSTATGNLTGTLDPNANSVAQNYAPTSVSIEANRLWVVTRIEELLSIFEDDDKFIDARNRAILNAEIANISKLYAESNIPIVIEEYKKILDVIHSDCTDPQLNYYRNYIGDHSYLKTAHSHLNTIIQFMIILTFQEYFGDPSNAPAREGSTLWSRLNWVLSVPEVDNVARAALGVHNESNLTNSYTVASLWRHIQSDLDRAANVIDAELLCDLIVALKGEDGFGGLNASLNSLCEEVSSTTNIVSKSNDLLDKSKCLYELIEGVSEKTTKLWDLFATIGYKPPTRR